MEDPGALLSFSSGNIAVYILALIVSISVVIFIHELGHYLAARYFAVRVQKFSLGFGRELWGFLDRRGTRWSLSAIPLGGYVTIFGDVDPEKPEIWDPALQQKRALSEQERGVAFCFKPAWQRFLIVAAGPAINIVFALCMFTVLFTIKGEVSSRPVVTGLAIGSSAYDAGFQVGDRILKMNGQDIRRFEEVWDVSYKQIGVKLTFDILRGAEIMRLQAAPRLIEYTDKNGLKESHGRLGATFFRAIQFKEVMGVEGENTKGKPDLARELIRENLGRQIEIDLDIGDIPETFLVVPDGTLNGHLSDPASKDYKLFYVFNDEEKFYFPHAPGMAFVMAGKKIAEIFDKAMKITVLIMTGGTRNKSLGGVGSMGNYAGKAVQGGVYSFFAFMAILSVQIAFINLLPIPVLDGGYMVFIGYEMLTKKPVSQDIQNAALIFGLVFLMGIIIIANVNDLLRLIQP